MPSSEKGDGPILVYATFPSRDDGERIGRLLVEQRLAACVNLLPGMNSIYRWEGRLCRDEECAAIIKTRRALLDAVTAAIRTNHSYANPAIVALEASGGSPQFLEWIMRETGTMPGEDAGS